MNAKQATRKHERVQFKQGTVLKGLDLMLEKGFDPDTVAVMRKQVNDMADAMHDLINRMAQQR